MAFEEKQRNLLARVLGLLGSDQEGEVLAAARRADAIVKAAGVTWSEVLGGGSIKTPAPPWNKDFSATPAPPAQDSVVIATNNRIRDILHRLQQRPLGNDRSIFDELFAEWHATGYLNPNQRMTLFDIDKRYAQGV